MWDKNRKVAFLLLGCVVGELLDNFFCVLGVFEDFKLNFMFSHCGWNFSRKLFNIIRQNMFQMAFCGEELAGGVATHRIDGHLPAQLGHCIGSLSRSGVRQLGHNANNPAHHRRTSLRLSGQLCWSARYARMQLQLEVERLKFKLLWLSLNFTTFQRLLCNFCDAFLTLPLDMLGMIGFGGEISTFYLVWIYRLNGFFFSTVLYKNVGWGNFEGYEKLEAVLRWDAFEIDLKRLT